MKIKSVITVSFVLVLSAVMCSFVAIDAKKPKLKGTKWEFREEIFLADVGTHTMTMTLEFTSSKEVTFTSFALIPSHPSMYMNEKGEVERVEESRSSRTRKGAYTVVGTIIKVTWEDHSTEEFEYKDGAIVQDDMVYKRK